MPNVAMSEPAEPRRRGQRKPRAELHPVEPLMVPLSRACAETGVSIDSGRYQAQQLGTLGPVHVFRIGRLYFVRRAELEKWKAWLSDPDAPPWEGL